MEKFQYFSCPLSQRSRIFFKLQHGTYDTLQVPRLEKILVLNNNSFCRETRTKLGFPHLLSLYLSIYLSTCIYPSLSLCPSSLYFSPYQSIYMYMYYPFRTHNFTCTCIIVPRQSLFFLFFFFSYIFPGFLDLH